jgi:chromosome partitioning protein
VSTACCSHRADETPSVTSIQPSRIAKAIQVAAASGASLVIIDTAPHSADAAMAAAEAADLILIPCRAGILDLRAIATTARVVKVAGTPAHVVLNHTPPRAPRLIEDAIAAVKQHGLAVAPEVLHQRSAYAHALTVGQTAQEYDPAGKAAGEIAALFKWLCMLLKM